MPRPLLFASALLLVACGAEPAEQAEPTEQAAAEGPRKPFVPPTDAKPVALGRPQPIQELVPGKNAGKAGPPDPRVTCSSSRAALTRRFGPDAVTDREVDLGEGQVAPGSVLGEGTSIAQEIVWADSAHTRAARIRVLGDGIRDPSGLGIGSTLAELEEALGPFQLSGFGWDYAGTVSLKGTKLDKLDGRVFFRLHPRATEGTEAALQAVSGDKLFASSDPNVVALDPAVGEFLLVCPH